MTAFVTVYTTMITMIISVFVIGMVANHFVIVCSMCKYFLLLKVICVASVVLTKELVLY